MSTDLREGVVFAGRYRVLSRIASGGMGAVYEVVHLETKRRRALKVMHPHILQSEEMRERFQREAKVTADIESEFIVDVFDAGIDAATGMPFLVMELLRGEELGKRVKRVGALPQAEVVTYLSQLAVALDKTHAASIVHRDLKPENLFLTPRDDGTPRIKILDFGVAKLVAEGTTQAGITNSVGTPLYMAPEQFRTDSVVSPASDIYALGMIAYALLVGKPYWIEESRRGANVFAFAIVAMQGPPDPATARALRAGVRLPPAFDTWFATTTAVDPARRFRSATAAANALAQVFGIAAPDPPPLAPLALPSSPAVLTTPMNTMVMMPGGEPASPAGQTEILLGSGDFMATSAQTSLMHAATIETRPQPTKSLPARTAVLAISAGTALGAVLLVALWPAPAHAPSPAATSSAPSEVSAPPPPPPPPASASAPPEPTASAAPPPASASAPPPAKTPAPPVSAKPKPPPIKPGKPSRYSQD